MHQIFEADEEPSAEAVKAAKNLNTPMPEPPKPPAPERQTQQQRQPTFSELLDAWKTLTDPRYVLMKELARRTGWL